VRPETILTWFRSWPRRSTTARTLARRAGHAKRPTSASLSRPSARQPGWGYTEIRDALRGLKIEIGRTTVANMLAEGGIEPAPERTRKRT